MTNSRYPEEICEGQMQMEEGSMMGLSYDMLDVSAQDMEDVDLYMQGLAVPARRNVNNADVQAGEQLFYQAGCHLCHVTTLHTKPRGSTLLMGTNLPWLGKQTIHPYSDYLLHDMGSEIMGVGLNDNFVSGLARGNEWRTTPLWGIGLQKKVNGHTYFLHDLLPARRTRPQFRRGHHVARWRGRSLEEQVQEHEQERARPARTIP